MYYRGNKSISSFAEIDSSSFEFQYSEAIKKEIEGESKEYILGVDENEYKNYLLSEYSLEPLQIYKETEIIKPPIIKKEIREDRFGRGDKYETETYSFTVAYKYTGSEILFKIRPNPRIMVSEKISVDSDSVSFFIKLYEQSAEKFKHEKESAFHDAFVNMERVNTFAESWNNKLPELIDTYFQKQRKKYLDENDFFAAINVKVNENTQSVFTAPTIKQKVIPQPMIFNKKEFASEPTIAKEMYEDILKVIYVFGKSMEQKPSTYQNKEEEGLRDQFLLLLETRYDATTATGETFNRGGKTDIILKYANDNSNLFVAECKFWHGSSEFLKAISQLFDRYLTWRDSKVALLLFVTNKDFTNVIQSIKIDVKKHPYYIKENGIRGETSFSYIFCLPQDQNKKVFLEVIAFHYDK